MKKTGYGTGLFGFGSYIRVYPKVPRILIPLVFLGDSILLLFWSIFSIPFVILNYNKKSKEKKK